MIVEDGTGINDANSYVSVEFADNYFSARGASGWAELETEAKEQALIRATDYIDNIFQWCGKKATAEQSLRFPRVNLKDYEGIEIVGIPTVLKQSVCDVALVSSGGTELFEVAEQNGDVVSETITSLSFTYSKTERTTTSKTLFDSVNTKLRGLYVDSTKQHIQMGRMHR
jgi:hypothetical protein